MLIIYVQHYSKLSYIKYQIIIRALHVNLLVIVNQSLSSFRSEKKNLRYLKKKKNPITLDGIRKILK